MKRLSGVLAASAVSVVLLAGVLVIAGAPAIGQSPTPPGRDVRVINGPNESVPVQMHGTASFTGDVNVLNTPGVNVANTPGVNVMNTPTVKLDTSQPIPVTNAGGTQEPYQLHVRLKNNQGDSNGVSGFSVPEGKRFVIEYVSAWLSAPGGLFILLGNDDMGSIALPVRTAIKNTGGSGDRYAGDSQVRFYVTGGVTVASGVDTGQGVGYSGGLTVVGYLV